MSDEIKRIDIKEFRESGLLAELNRTFLHPLGLALEVVIDDETSKEKLGGIWDYRDDPEGILYGEETLPILRDRCKNAQKIIKEKHEQRMKILGYVFQDVDNPQ